MSGKRKWVCQGPPFTPRCVPGWNLGPGHEHCGYGPADLPLTLPPEVARLAAGIPPTTLPESRRAIIAVLCEAHDRMAVSAEQAEDGAMKTEQGPADCARRSHWIGSHVGNTEPGYGHDGGFTGTPCITYEAAIDCDPLALCTVTPPAVQTDGEPTP